MLQDLLMWSQPLDNIATRLQQFPWDWDGDALVTLRRDDVRAILSKFRSGDVSSASVESWANLIELRDAIDFEGGDEGPVRDVIHVLANPALEGELTIEAALQLEAELLNGR
ncbi:hypothetical protein [Phenylobacterium sp.]|uniref:hypothetical protein n=1 Tax=Phenylobacterium sp. TaxID=1871053 RepID=UPI0027333908|nr:hypothetical protein [Phenylobacterium sp.]MDP3853248.1 hypothetical protein [Phenylobacterium sp.]